VDWTKILKITLTFSGGRALVDEGTPPWLAEGTPAPHLVLAEQAEPGHVWIVLPGRGRLRVPNAEVAELLKNDPYKFHFGKVPVVLVIPDAGIGDLPALVKERTGHIVFVPPGLTGLSNTSTQYVIQLANMNWTSVPPNRSSHAPAPRYPAPPEPVPATGSTP